MPSPKNQRREEKGRSGAKRAASFHGKGSGSGSEMLVRPRTVPDLGLGRGVEPGEGEVRVRMAKLLLKVTVERSPGAVLVVMDPESTVGDLIVAVLKQYKKEGRRPMLQLAEAAGFDLHYSLFSLESLDRNEKLVTLGSRNFFLYPRKSTSITKNNHNNDSDDDSMAMLSCAKQAGKANKIVLPWLKFLF